MLGDTPYNFTKPTTWFNNTLYIDIITTGKFGVSLFTLRYSPTRDVSFLLWREDDYVFRVAKLKEGSTVTKFQLGDSNLDYPITDHTFGSATFDVLGNFQAVTIPTNISCLGPYDDYLGFNCSLYTIASSEIVKYVPGQEYSFIPDSELSTPFGKMRDGEWFIWEHTSFRWEVAHPAVFTLAMCWYLGIFIILIAFRRNQPLFSRGIVPWMANLISLISLITSTRNWSTPETRERTGCLINAIFTNPISITLAFGGVIIYVRYNIMRLINHRKQFLIKNKNQSVVSKSGMMKFYDISQRWWVQGLMVVFLFGFTATSFVVFAQFMQKDFLRCENQKYLFIGYVTIAFLLMYANFPIAIYLVWDDIKNLRWKTIFWSDPLNFKFELYVIYTFVYIYVIIAQTALDRGLYPGQWWKLMVWSFQFHFMWMAQTGFPIIMTLYTWIRTFRARGKISTSELVEILDDPKGLELFYEFSEKEFSSENVSCYDDIRLYEHEVNDDIARQMAEKILHLYLMGSQSELEVNVSKEEREVVRKEIESGSILTPNLFESLKMTLINNLTDVYSRLKFTSRFHEYMQESNILKQWQMQSDQNKSYLKSFRTENELRTKLL